MSKKQDKKYIIKDKIMQAICEVRFGETISYSELAERAGFKGKIRYVASFLKENSYPIAIPCHRIIKKNGDYGNYRLGENLKKFLIDREKSIISRS